MGALGQGSEAGGACVKTTGALCILPQGAPLAEETAAHIASCKRRRQLASMSQAGSGPDLPLAGRWNRIQSAILRDLKPVRPLAAAMMPPVSAGGWRALTTYQRVAVFTLIGAGGALLTADLVIATALLFRPRQEPEFLANGAVCFRLGISYSIPAAVSLCAALRRGAFIRPWLSGMIIDGFGGLAGMAVLELN
jgi:hypothetical protein